MPRQILGPRKQRTRQHVIADLSVNYVERIILEAGHTTQRVGSDYGYDLIMWTFDERGYVEPRWVVLQIKGAETLQAVGSDFVFDLDIRDYNLWMLEEFPVILILYEASRRKAYWLAVQRYFLEDPDRQPKRGVKTVRVRVPQLQALTRRAIAKMRDLKKMREYPVLGVES